ncbi:MAG: hypothetical protein ACOCWZ_12340 [Spirochaetota bacterium]
MNKLSFVLFSILLSASSLQAATDVDVNRTHIWGNFIYHAQMDRSGSGLYVKYSARYNLLYEKSVDGAVADTITQGLWINELFIGPEFAIKLSRKSKITTTPLYRVQGLYLDEKKSHREDMATADPETYFKHTFFWPTRITYTRDFITFGYRLAFWHLLPYDYIKTGEDYHADAEFFSRHRLECNFHVLDWLDLYLWDEVFLLHTAGDKGEQVFYRNAVWTGLLFKPVIHTTFRLGYTHYYTRAERSPAIDKDIHDHYIYLAVSYSSDYSNVSLLPY